MMTKTKVWGRIVAMIVAIVMVVGVMPTFSLAVNSADPRVVDPATHNSYEDLFYEGDDGIIDTYMAGSVWTDKSVFTTSSLLNPLITMNDEDNNFLVALSAIAANKEIVGYSSIPTDTVFVIDVSNSMSSSSISQMATAVNDAIKQLYKTNNHNRIGVVIYGGSVKTLFELDRYNAGNGGNFITYTSRGNTISVANGVTNSDGDAVTGSVSQNTGTYIQGGIWEAMEILLAADTKIPSGQIQGGSSRLPIVVLMTDGDPSRADSDYTDVGNANISSTSNRATFLTMLTMAYAKGRINAHYGADGGHSALFYTLGYDVASSNHAKNILNPDNMTSPFSGYATTFLSAREGSTVTLGTGRDSFSVTKVSGIDSLVYSDKYFSAAQGNINSAFDSIVQEIVIQSKYYATHFEANPDFDGYLTFEDNLGDYIDAVDIKGVLYDNNLFTGDTLASKINTTELGTIERPTEFGTRFRDAVMTRLSIKDTTTSFALITDAYNAGQIGMHNGEAHNEIHWYGDADNNFVAHWNEGVTTPPAGAVYENRSYFYLGTITDGLAASDMMFMSSMIQRNIETGEERVLWRIPAALMPMITYNVSFMGTSVDAADDVELTVDRNVPVRLVYEATVDPLVNERSINEIMAGDLNSAKYKDGDGWRLWLSYFDKSALSHDDHEAAKAEFTPSMQNEHYYYVEDTPIYIKNGSTYTKLTDENHNFSSANEYVHLLYEFSTAFENSIERYEPITEAALNNRKYVSGAWYIKQGTIYRHILAKDVVEKVDNPTDSIGFSRNTFVLANNDVLHKVGNNGTYSITSATGIKLSKTIDGGSVLPETFEFEITFSENLPENEYPFVLAELDESVGVEGTIQVTDGNKLTFELQSDKTIWITDLPAGVSYEIKEVSTNFDYAVKTVSVNGVAQNGIVASDTIEQQEIDDVDFVNALADKGAVNVTKEVVHPLGVSYQIPDNLTFDAKITFSKGGALLENFEVTLVNASGESKLTTTAFGEVEFSLKNGETVQIKGVPEGCEYTVEELNIPNGFKLTTADENLKGAITIGAKTVTLTNEYTPDPTALDLALEITKYLDGREWNDGEEYTFILKSAKPEAPSDFVQIAEIKVTEEGVKTVKNLTETYDKVGIYHYLLTEVEDSTTNGVTYDKLERRFHVHVVDTDMDGKLEVEGAENVMNTTITGDATNGFTVSTRFDNNYAVYTPTPITIVVEKAMDSLGGTHSLNGFKFGLYPTYEGDIVESTLTDANGNARFEITFSPESAGSIFEYELKEIDTGIAGITYDDRVYDVKVEVIDNLDGTSSSRVTITDELGNAVTTPVFTNLYTPKTGYTTLDATKTLVGRTLKAGEFSFELVNSANVVVQTKTNAADGTIVFDEIPLTSDGTYTYTIREAKGTDSSITYDDTVYTVEITVVQNGSEYVEESVKYFIGTTEVGGADFINTYTAKPTSTQITAEKELVGRTLKDGEFEFELYDEAGTLLQTKTNVGKTITFDDVSLEKAGTYKFTVKEKVTNLSGVTYDSSEYTVTVTVYDNGAGQLVVSSKTIAKNGTSASAIKFINTYVAAATTGEIPVKKVLTGKTLEAGEFAFVLKNAKTGGTIATIRNTASGEFAFENIPFNTAGEYFFEIHEIDENKTGYTYDLSIYALKVVVVDDSNGQLKVDQTVIAKDGVTVAEIVFNNSYSALTSLPETITGTKTLDKLSLEGDDFSFELRDKDNKVVQTKKNDANGILTFDPITFSKAGTHVYTVNEVIESTKGITWDTSVYTLTYEVEDVDGRFTVVSKTLTKNGAAATEITFANLFTPETANANLIAAKTLVGRTLKAGEFSFELVNSANVVLQTKTNGANGAVVFDAIPLTAEGVYTYTIREAKGTDSSVTYDDTVYTVEVTVVQEGKEYVAKTVKYFIGTTEVGGAEFENVYTAKATSTQITAEKELVGRTLKDGEFEFELYDEAGTLLQTKTNVGKTITFDDVSLEKAGTYKFTVKEKAGSLSGVTYDDSEYTVTIVVTDDGAGQLVVSSKTIAKNGTSASAIKFINTYVAAATTGEIPVKKVLTGKALADGEFGFVLKDSTGATVATIRNTASGEFAFENIPFNTAGEYFFEIHEIDENKTGYTYDSAIYAVKVVVVDEGNGQLKVDQTVITKDGTPVTEVVFNNFYGAVESFGETISGLKTIKGATLVGGDFEFELRNSANEVVDTVTNDINGIISFNGITFDAAGTHVYTVNEVVGTVEGMTYDSKVYTVEFDVEDVGGRFTVVDKRVTLNGSDAAIVFNNVYEEPIVIPAAIAVPLKVQKIVDNKTTQPMGLGHFEFKLVGDLAATDMTVTTNYKGEAKFELSFSDYNVGKSYSYKLYETNTGIYGMQYSQKVYDIRVDVTETPYNTIDATFYVDGVKTEYEDLVFEFVNVYGEGTPQKPTGGASTGGDSAAGIIVATALLGGIIAAVALRKKR